MRKYLGIDWSCAVGAPHAGFKDQYLDGPADEPGVGRTHREAPEFDDAWGSTSPEGCPTPR